MDADPDRTVPDPHAAEAAARRRERSQTRSVIGLLALVAVLVLALIITLASFYALLDRRSVVAKPLNCNAEKMGEFATGITDLLAVSHTNDDAAEEKAYEALRRINFDKCKVDAK